MNPGFRMHAYYAVGKSSLRIGKYKCEIQHRALEEAVISGFTIFGIFAFAEMRKESIIHIIGFSTCIKPSCSFL